MALALLCAVLYVLSYATVEALVVPTVNSTESEIYNTSVPNEYENNTILCSKKHCEIICDTSNGCHQTAIYANDSDTITLKCLAYDSCNHINIISSAKLSTVITCQNQRSCAYSNFNVENSRNFSLTCDGGAPPYATSTDGECNHANVSASSSTHVWIQCVSKYLSYTCFGININASAAKLLNINCDGAGACASANIYCPYTSANSKCIIECPGGTSCWSMDIYIENEDVDIDLYCNGTEHSSCGKVELYCINSGRSSILESTQQYFVDLDHKYSCTTDDCCPDSFHEEIIICNTLSCIVDCVNTDCATYLINGSSAASLTVHCDSSSTGSCALTHIYCPDNANATCIIDCNGKESCYRAFIKAENSYSLDVICDGWDACSRSEIKCPVTKTAVCAVNCYALSACEMSSIYAANTYLLNLDCSSQYGCKYASIYCPFDRESACNIDCSGRMACYLMDIYVDDSFTYDYLSLVCISNDDTACRWMNINCPSKGNVTMVLNAQLSEYQCPDIAKFNELYCCPFIYTKTPTEYPSLHTMAPTTNNPTNNPTNTPSDQTALPTSNPTHMSSAPTSLPSAKPMFANRAIYTELCVRIHVLISLMFVLISCC